MTTTIIRRSKIGIEILVPVILVLGPVMTLMIIKGLWLGILICGIVILLFIDIYTGTFYKITSDKLFIKCGMLQRFEIDIDQYTR